MSKVIGLKLVTGEEIIAKVVSRLGDGKITIESPMSIQLMQDKGGVRVGLIPFLHLTQFRIGINLSAVVAEFEPDAEMQTGYLSQISGIVLK